MLLSAFYPPSAFSHPRFILHPHFLIRVLSSIRIFSSAFYPPSAFSYPRFILHPHFLIRIFSSAIRIRHPHPYPRFIPTRYIWCFNMKRTVFKKCLVTSHDVVLKERFSHFTGRFALGSISNIVQHIKIYKCAKFVAFNPKPQFLYESAGLSHFHAKQLYNIVLKYF